MPPDHSALQDIEGRLPQVRASLERVVAAFMRTTQGADTLAEQASSLRKVVDELWVTSRNVSRKIARQKHQFEASLTSDYLSKQLSLRAVAETLDQSGVVHVTSAPVLFFGHSASSIHACEDVNVDQIAVRVPLDVKLPRGTQKATLHFTIGITFGSSWRDVLYRSSGATLCDEAGRHIDLPAILTSINESIDQFLQQANLSLDDIAWDLSVLINEHLDLFPAGTPPTNPHHFEEGGNPHRSGSGGGPLKHKLTFINASVGEAVSFLGEDELETYLTYLSETDVQRWKEAVERLYGALATPSPISTPLALVSEMNTAPSWQYDAAIKFRTSLITTMVDHAIRKKLEGQPHDRLWFSYQGITLVENSQEPSKSCYLISLISHQAIPRWCVDPRLVIHGPFPWNWYFECRKWSAAGLNLNVGEAAIFDTKPVDGGIQLIVRPSGSVPGDDNEITFCTIRNAQRVEVQLTNETFTMFVKFIAKDNTAIGKKG